MEIITGKLPKPYKVVLYGPEGIGKSTFASQMPDPLFIDTEGSTSRMDVKRLPTPTSLPMIMEEIFYVRDTPGICQSLVLDSADWTERFCRQNTCAKYNKTGLEDFGYGKGYSYVYEDFGRVLNALDEVHARGVHIFVTAHAAMRKFEQPDEDGSYDRWELKLINAPKCNSAAMLKEWADMVLFANYETIVVKNEEKKTKAKGGRRVMYTTHHACWDAKNRDGLPDKLPFEFRSIAHLFGSFAVSQTIPAQQQIPDPAPQQVQPVPDTSPVSVKRQVSVSQDEVASPFPSNGIPQGLLDLMQQNNVTEQQICTVVAQKGYYPANTPINKYDPAFIEGVLIGAWQQVYQMIKGEV